MLRTLAPPLFVAIWSTGFLVARAIRGQVDPNLFLAARFTLMALLFVPVALAAGVAWPRGRAIRQHLLAGVLIQGVYLGLGYTAIARGLPAAVMALIGALQPLLVALAARTVLGERATSRTWAGLLIGVAGVALVVAPRLAAGDAGAGSASVLVMAVLSIVSLTGGTLIQKTSLASTDLRSASAIQNVGAAATAGLLALGFGETTWTPGAEQWAALGWAALVVSGGGTTLLVWMVRSGTATQASALLLAVPPLVAVETFFVFGEALSAVQITGFGVALAGVWLARQRPKQAG